MYIDYKNWEEFDRKTAKFKGQFYSPGTSARVCNVKRQNIYNWIVRDKIDAHRYSGPQGEYIYIPITELDKLGCYEKQLKLY